VTPATSLELVARRPVRSTRMLLSFVIAAGVALMIAAVPFAWIALRDSHAMAHGRRLPGVVTGVTAGNGWNPFDGGRLRIAFHEGSAIRMVHVYSDHEATTYRIGDPVTVVVDGGFVRTDRESNDPPAVGFAFAILGVAGLLTGCRGAVGFGLNRVARRRLNATPTDQVPLIQLLDSSVTGSPAWVTAGTKNAWLHYAEDAGRVLAIALVLAAASRLSFLPQRATQSALSAAAATAVAVLVMARRLIKWRFALGRAPWKSWSAEVVEVPAGRATTSLAILTGQVRNEPARMICRAANPSPRLPSHIQSGELRVCPDGWFTLIVLDNDGRMRRFVLPRTTRTRRRWYRKHAKFSEFAKEADQERETDE
jgi:hypothetical protein